MKSSKYVARLYDSRGQAAIEYVLLLIITVSLILLLVYQIFKPMQKFVENAMGKYVECLLETGELPTLGGRESQMMAECPKLAFGDGTDADSAGGSKNSSKSGDSSKSSSNSSSSSDSDSSSGSGGSGSSSSSGTYAGSSSRSHLNSSSGRGTSGTDGKKSNPKVVEVATGAGANGFFRSGSGGSSSEVAHRKISSVDTSNFTLGERKKLEKKATGAGKTTSVATDDNGPGPKKISVKSPEQKSQFFDEESKPFTIGNFIRYLIIAAILIALLLFIGGQALQMSKNMEK